MKIIIVATLVVLGLVFAIKRIIGNKQQMDRLNDVLQAAEDPDVAKEIASHLHEKYYYKNLAPDFKLVDYINTLQSELTIRTSKIDLIKIIDDNTALVITTCKDSDFELKANGRFGDAEKVFNINYALRFNPQNNQLTVCSDYVRDGNLRGLRLSFASAFLEKIS